jgi:hypothetical protein
MKLYAIRRPDGQLVDGPPSDTKKWAWDVARVHDLQLSRKIARGGSDD